MINTVILGNCLDKLKDIPDNSIDSIVTDPPYELGFMGKSWDKTGIANNVEMWKECLRVLKPGGHLLSFSGTRTYHRMASAVEDAGFEVRDMISWIYGSGFPKSLNIGKAIDKMEGTEYPKNTLISENGSMTGGNYTRNTIDIQSEKAKQWEGWGTALKPACEPCVLARKPLSEKTVAENVLKWGTGGINIDGSRVEGKDGVPLFNKRNDLEGSSFKGGANRTGEIDNTTGRFPANLVHSGEDEVLALFPNTKGKFGMTQQASTRGLYEGGKSFGDTKNDGVSDSGSAARFFYCAKTSKSERNRGLDSTLTVKYTGDICKEENMVAVELLKRVMSDTEVVNFSTGESGESLMVQFPKDSSSIIKTTTNRIMTSRILSLLMLSLTNESIVGVNSEMENGGSLVENVESLKQWILTITKDQMALALGASRVALQMLSRINEEENWEDSTNFHATVKPQALMKYLIKLITPPGGTVLDPFAGSGSTLVAAKDLGHNYIGIEMTEEYIPIIQARLK